MNRIPNPNGCRWCGIDQDGHGRRWKPDAGVHAWEQPTQQQIKERMQARREQARSRKLRRDLETQLYAADPSDRADAYLALQDLDGREDPAVRGHAIVRGLAVPTPLVRPGWKTGRQLPTTPDGTADP